MCIGQENIFISAALLHEWEMIRLQQPRCVDFSPTAPLIEQNPERYNTKNTK